MRTLISFLLFAAGAFAQNTCLNFPAGLIPLSSIAYVTAANSAGDRLVVGSLANGLNTLSRIPLPDTTNQLFCDASVQIAAGQFFPNVYVPTAAERSGNFSAFAGLIVNPTGTNIPYPGGIIPPGQLGSVYAFRIGAVQTTDTARNWSLTGSLIEPQAFLNSGVVLPSGKVLIVGNNGNSQIYDPIKGAFAAAGQSLFAHGSNVTTTALNDGRVLIVGGTNVPTAVELYDPSSGRFVATGAMIQPHGYNHTATLLNDGRVLVVGGLITAGNGGTAGDLNAGAEIFDPKTGTFARTGALNLNRNLHSATLLADGRVLVAGGYARGAAAPGNIRYDTAEIYDPAKATFSALIPMQQPRSAHVAVLLPSGKVLLAGGDFDDSSAELFDPATSRFTYTGSMSNSARSVARAVLLSSGQVLVTGGQGISNGPTTAAELYNPATGTFSTTGSMVFPRFAPIAVLLLDGRLLVAGGFSNAGLSSAELYTPVVQGLVASQTGLTFRGAQGAGALASQNIVVLSSSDTIPYNVTVKTFTGGGWLKATPASATSAPGSPANLTITTDATGLAATDYYGAVTLSPTDGKHPPVSIAIVLTIVPAGAAAPPGVTPTGLVFTSTTGTSPSARTFVVSNVTSKALTFAGVATQATSFFDFAPKTGSVAAGQSQSITVTPSSATLAAGAYRGSIKLTFGDGTAQTVDVLLVATAPAGTITVPEDRGATAACTPAKLLPVLTTIPAGFTTPLAWPTSITVQVVDDCGTAINAGAVTASFTNGDLPLSLIAIGNGMWSATWVPVRPSASTGVRADAQSLKLTGTVQVSGQVATNPKVPVVAAGGVLSSGDYKGSPAQGLLASIFGVALADGALGNSSLPLPMQLGSTTVVVSGVPVPVLYVSENQVNVFIPYELAVNAPHQLILQRGNAISVPVPISVFDNQPAILATAGNGAGQGHIYKITSAGAQILASASAPAKAGDVLVIYTVGLGPVNPPLKSGDPAPLTFLEPITGTAAVTIGGISAPVAFAGLTPAFSGLYQVNVTVPTGITPGNQVPVTVSVNGRAGAGSITMAVQ